jgi:anti-sigma factor ChrR (cupin superfamily)
MSDPATGAVKLLQMGQLLQGGWAKLDFAPFHDAVTIHRLYEDTSGAAAAVLKYTAGAAVPRHLHTGYEHILVLDGAQADDEGVYAAGDLVINKPGTIHRVWSEQGCVALLIWERPVKLLA